MPPPGAGRSVAAMFSKVITGPGGDALALAATLAPDAELIRSTARSLTRVAAAERADLIVVGRWRADCDELLDCPPCAVAIAPPGYRGLPRELRLVGVGFDASPAALRALAIAESIAQRAQAEVHLRVVAEPRACDFDLDGREFQARGLLRRTLCDAHVPADGDVIVGQPGQALQALSMQVDLLVCGTHGWRGCFERLIPGSTAEWLAHHAGCPVLITPLAAAREMALAG
jgi:nucleotide-binding universal stress UspA family protein